MAIKKKKGGAVAGSDNEKLSVALDIGSSTLRIIAGHVTEDLQIKVKGYLEYPSSGVSKGSISDINKLASSIAYLIQEFQTKFGITVNHVITGVPGVYICAENQTGTATVQNGTVSIADRNRAIKNALAGITKINTSEYSLIHSTPQSHMTELSRNISNPVGQYARRIEVITHIIGCKNFYKLNIEHAINKTSTDISASAMIYDGNAAASSVLTEAEKEIGVITVDIGSGTTSATVFEGKKQLVSFGVDDGGDYITVQIAKAYSISMSDAELLKVRCGYASRYLMSEEDATFNTTMRVDAGSDKEFELEINYGELADVINRALNSIFDYLIVKIYSEVSQITEHISIGGGFVLTGGGSKLYGIDKVLQNALAKYRDNPSYSMVSINDKVRLGHPKGISLSEDCGISNQKIYDSDKAVVTGLLRSARFEDRKQYTIDDSENEAPKGRFGSIMKGVKNWFKNEF